MILRAVVGCFLSCMLFLGHAAFAGSSDSLDSLELHFRNVDIALTARNHRGAIESLRTIEREYAGKPEIARECAARVLPLIADVKQSLGVRKYALWIHARAAKTLGREYFEKHMEFVEKALDDKLRIAFQAVATLQVFQDTSERRSIVVATLQNVATTHYSQIVATQANKRLTLLGEAPVVRAFKCSGQDAAAVGRCRVARSS